MAMHQFCKCAGITVAHFYKVIFNNLSEKCLQPSSVLQWNFKEKIVLEQTRYIRVLKILLCRIWANNSKYQCTASVYFIVLLINSCICLCRRCCAYGLALQNVTVFLLIFLINYWTKV